MPIPTLFSLITHVVRIPSPGGTREATCSYGVGGAPSSTQCDLITGVFLNTIVADLMSSAATHVRTEMRDQVVAYENNTAEAGTKGPDLAPPNVSVLVRKSTGLLGRKNTGRMYPPGIAQDATFNAAGIMSAGDYNVYQGSFNDFYDGLVDIGAAPYLFHSDETAPTEIEEFRVEQVASTQRRRLRK